MFKTIFGIFIAFLLLSGCDTSTSSSPGTVWTISGNGIVMKATQKHGAAITSITWNGLEFINSDDVGRDLQTAYWLDKVGTNDGGNNNPNEAGGSSKNPTPTQILSADIPAPNILETQVHPALWFPYNGQNITSDIIHKTITIGYKDMPNVIEHTVIVTAAADHSYNNLMVLAGYMTKSFTKLYQYDPTTKQISEVIYTPVGNNPYLGMTGLKNPLIVASPDGKYAMGVYSKKGTYSAYMQMTQNVIASSGTINVWEAGLQEFQPWKAGTYTTNVFYIVGTLADVQASMTKLISS